MDYIDIIEKSIYNIDSKICGIIDDYKVLQDSQKVADYVIQFLRTYLEHIAARIYAHENPNKQVPIRGKDKWYTQYMKPLKENNEYGYIWDLHHSLQITTSHYVPAEDGAIRLMDGYLSQLYQLRDQMREKFGLVLMSNLEGYPQEKNFELDPYYEKIYIALKGIHLEDGTKYTNDRYYITRKKYRTVNGKGFFEYTLSYAQEEITKFDRFVAYSFNDIPDNYSIQCDFAQANVDFNGVDIDIKCLIAWNVSIRPCELEKLVAICGYDIEVRTDNLYYKALMKFLSRTGMNLLDILLADEEDYEIYIQQVELSKKPELEETFDKIREIIIGEKPGSNILRYITAYLKNDVIRDQLADRSNNRLSYLYLKNEAIPFDEMPYASSLCGHNLLKSRLNKCLEIYDCEHQYVSAMVNKEAYDKTVETGKVTFFSRTKNRLWTKGVESGNFLHVVSIKADCDNDTLLIQVEPVGPVCHTGTDTCWGEKNEEPVMFLKALQDFIDKRHEEMPEGSYTTSLFESGINKIAQKVGEEAVETVIEATNGTDERLIYEGADLIYHMIVLLASKGYRIEDLARELQERHSSTWKKH